MSRLAYLVSLAMLLAACGGGGSSGSTNVPAPSALSYMSPGQTTVGTAITPLSPTVSGTVSSYAVSPALPAGLLISTTSGVISGTPTASASQATYTITASNSSGSTTFGLSLTVNPAAPTALSYTTPVQATVGTAIAPLSPTVTGTVASYSVTPALPAGLSLNTTTGAIAGTPTAAAPQATYTITATNVSGSMTFGLSLTITRPPLSIAAVSTNSPMALTPLYVTTSGLDPTKPAAAVLSNSTGYSATLTPMQIKSDGTIVIAVPLYIDPTTANTGALNVTLTITQGSEASAPVNLSIQDIPKLSDYGTSLGLISHSFFVFQALQLAESANEIQSIQLGAAAAIDVAPLLNDLAARTDAVVRVLAEIDRVMKDNSVVIPAGTLPDGTTAQFDQTSLAMMDRVIGVYLTEVFSTVPVAAAAVLPVLPMSQRQHVTLARAAPTAWGPSLPGKIATGTNVSSLVTGIQNAQQSCSSQSGSVQACVSDLSAAVGAGISEAATALNAAAIVNRQLWFAQAVGAVGAAVSTASTTGQVLGDLAAFSKGLLFQDTATMNSAITEMRGLDQLALADAVLSLAAAPEFAGLAAANATLTAGSAVVGFVKFVFDQAKAGVDQTDRAAALSLAVAAAQKASQQPASQPPLIGALGGTVQPSMNPPGVLPTMTGIGLQPFGSGGAAVDALADPSGSYQMYAPLAVSGTNYSSLVVSAFDPTTGAAIGSNVVDLSGLTSTTPQILSPIIQGVSVQASCTVAQQTAWNQACYVTYSNQSAPCDTLPTLIQQLQCVNAALAAYEACFGSCKP